MKCSFLNFTLHLHERIVTKLAIGIKLFSYKVVSANPIFVHGIPEYKYIHNRGYHTINTLLTLFTTVLNFIKHFKIVYQLNAK